MNAGAHGGETKDVLIEARGVDRQAAISVSSECGDGLTATAIAACRTT